MKDINLEKDIINETSQFTTFDSFSMKANRLRFLLTDYI